MKQFEEQPEKRTGRQVLLRILDKYVPSENSNLAGLIRWLVILWRVVKFLCVIAGLYVIYLAIQVVGTVYTTIPPLLFKWAHRTAAYFIPLFLDLIMASFKFLWQPILVYVLIAILTKSRFWRRFWCLVGVAGFFLIFVSAFENSSWKEYQLLPLLLIQGYLFALWLLPREIWNIIGLIISLVLGLTILILPDLPTALDDFGMFGAILAFFLGYLNVLASLIQRIVRRL
jgi:hypothetical protein